MAVLEPESALHSIYFSIPESDGAMRFALVVSMLEMALSDSALRRGESKSKSPYSRPLRGALNALKLAT